MLQGAHCPSPHDSRAHPMRAAPGCLLRTVGPGGDHVLLRVLRRGFDYRCEWFLLLSPLLRKTRNRPSRPPVSNLPWWFFPKSVNTILLYVPTLYPKVFLFGEIDSLTSRTRNDAKSGQGTSHTPARDGRPGGTRPGCRAGDPTFQVPPDADCEFLKHL